jgi:hypothetical protein
MITSVSDVDQLDSQLDAQVESLNAGALACKTLAPADMTIWSGVYAAWKALHQQWAIDKHIASITFGGGSLSMLYFANEMLSQMQGYRQQLPAWHAKVHAACPAYQIPPDIIVPVPPPPGSDPLDKFTRAAQVVGTTAVTLAIAFAVFKAVQIAGVFQKAAS